MNSRVVGTEPYRGARSYRVQDRALFFGREDDVDRIRALVCANRVTVLHAPSGAGKTSLIGTLLVPQLEAQGHTTVLCRPAEDTARAVGMATLARLLPPPGAELATLQRVATLLSSKTTAHDLPLAAIKQRYRHLTPDDPAYGQIVDDVELAADSPLRTPGAPPAVTPVLARFLYLQVGAPPLVAYLARLEAALGDGEDFWRQTANLDRARDVQQVMNSYTLGQLENFLKRVDRSGRYQLFLERHATWRGKLSSFFQDLEADIKLSSQPHRVTLILDQFEEFFTLFGERSEATKHAASALIDYRRRNEFFSALAELLCAESVNANGMRGPLPLQVLISMRDDYVARIDELEHRIGPIDSREYYHLTVLTPRSARDAIGNPARLFGYDYDPNVYEQLAQGLTEEGTKVEPGQIQIVCERLWREFGQALHAQHLERRRRTESGGTGGEDGRETARITMAQLDELGGIRGILETHFRRFLSGYSPVDRVDILDMLTPLITSRHTRNIVMKDVVVGRRFVDRQRRESLFEDLRVSNILRVETHRSGALVEIMHEFLIQPIEEEIAAAREEIREWTSLGRAFGRLETIERQGFRTATDGLRTDELQALFWYRDRLDQEHLSNWLAEAQLRSAILDTSDNDQRSACLMHWAERIDEAETEIDAKEILGSLPARVEEQRWLDHWELDALASAELTDEIAPGTQLFLLESALRNAHPETTSVIIGRYLE